jgi:hypothetical protein
MNGWVTKIGVPGHEAGTESAVNTSSGNRDEVWTAGFAAALSVCEVSESLEPYSQPAIAV